MKNHTTQPPAAGEAAHTPIPWNLQLSRYDAILRPRFSFPADAEDYARDGVEGAPLYPEWAVVHFGGFFRIAVTLSRA